jgi:hypothetical protein
MRCGEGRGEIVARAFLLLAVVFFPSAAQSPAQGAVSCPAAEGLRVRQSLHGHIRGTVLLFERSMSNRGECETLGERFAAAGYFALAIDQRTGGYRWGLANLTMRRIGPKAS